MTAPAPVLPWMHPAIRSLLLADPAFYQATGGRCSTRATGDVTQPYATIQFPGGFPTNASAGVWTPLVQIDGWCAPEATEDDPEAVVWRIASTAASVLARARNVAYQNVHFTARVTDGPLPDEDISRGAANPIYRCLVRAELNIHAR